MKVKEFNALKEQVKGGNVKGLTKEVIGQLTLKQAKVIENVMMDLELTDEMHALLDEVVAHIVNHEERKALKAEEKVANKKAPKPEVPEKPAKVEKVQPANKVKVGDIVRFRVEGEEIEHEIKVIYKSRYDVICISRDEREVFKVRKTDFNRLAFQWTDRKNETYNIIVTL